MCSFQGGPRSPPSPKLSGATGREPFGEAARIGEGLAASAARRLGSVVHALVHTLQPPESGPYVAVRAFPALCLRRKEPLVSRAVGLGPHAVRPPTLIWRPVPGVRPLGGAMGQPRAGTGGLPGAGPCGKHFPCVNPPGPSWAPREGPPQLGHGRRARRGRRPSCRAAEQRCTAAGGLLGGAVGGSPGGRVRSWPPGPRGAGCALAAAPCGLRGCSPPVRPWCRVSL